MQSRAVLLAGAVALAGILPCLSSAAQRSHIGLNQRVLVICVKTAGAATVRRTAADWVSILNSQVNDQIKRASYNQTSYVFVRPSGAGVPADGWFQLPYAIDAWPGTLKGAIDAAKLADPYVNMGTFDRLTIIVNSANFGGQTVGWHWIPVSEGSESTEVIDGVSTPVRQMSVSAQNEWLEDSYWSKAAGNTRDEGASVIAHELGHHLKLQTHYTDIKWSGEGTRDAITPWDIMGLSPGWNEYLGWAKYDRGWLPAGDATTVGPPGLADITQTVSINPIHYTAGTRLIRVPFSGGAPFVGYAVELRQNDTSYTNRNAWGTVLPQGALVTLINEDPAVWYGTKAIVMTNPAFPEDNTKAVLRPGDSFTDSAHGITITCNSLASASAAGSVTVKYNHPPDNFNANITPWGAPPYESADIWVDSEKNGWGFYKYADGSGNPVGNGDPAWVRQLPDGSWRANRVWVRVRNTGPDAMANVKVQVYVNDPPGLGDSGASWPALGTIVFPTVAGYSEVSDYVIWKPKVAAHTCLKALINLYPNETNTGDNQAQENVTMFETTASSPYLPVTLKAKTESPLAEGVQVLYEVTNIPKGWRWRVEPMMDWVSSKEPKFVSLTMYPPNPRYNQRYVQGQVFNPKITALMLFGDAWMPVGGIEMWTHLVYKTAITLNAGVNRYGIIGGGILRRTQPTYAPLPYQRVAVSLIPYNKEKSVPITLVVRTDDLGHYKASFTKLQPGPYLVQASFAGDKYYQSCDSRVIQIVW